MIDSFKILGNSKDLRTNTVVVYASIDIRDYVRLINTGSVEKGAIIQEVDIQRKRQNLNDKTYKRLSEDIKKGALLPTITLAISPDEASKYEKFILNDERDLFLRSLTENRSLYILDGLQRTYIIENLSKSNEINLNQKIHLEIWLEKEVKHLIYRFIILNSGQKRVTVRHQLELLFYTLKNDIIKKVPGIEIVKENDDADKRKKGGVILFSRLVTGYNCFVYNTSEIDNSNIVIEKLRDDDFLNSTEDQIDAKFNLFIAILKKYIEIDCLCYLHYSAVSSQTSDLHISQIQRDGTEISEYENKNYDGRSPLRKSLNNEVVNFFFQENTIRSFFGAIGHYVFATTMNTEEYRKNLVFDALDRLIDYLKGSKSNNKFDPLFFVIFNNVKAGIDPKKVNVGVATRRIIYDAFVNYFRNGGDLDLSKLWLL